MPPALTILSFFGTFRLRIWCLRRGEDRGLKNIVVVSVSFARVEFRGYIFANE